MGNETLSSVMEFNKRQSKRFRGKGHGGPGPATRHLCDDRSPGHIAGLAGPCGADTAKEIASLALKLCDSEHKNVECWSKARRARGKAGCEKGHSAAVVIVG